MGQTGLEAMQCYRSVLDASAVVGHRSRVNVDDTHKDPLAEAVVGTSASSADPCCSPEDADRDRKAMAHKEPYIHSLAMAEMDIHDNQMLVDFLGCRRSARQVRRVHRIH